MSRKKKFSIPEKIHQSHEFKKQSDFIYRVFMDLDTKEIDHFIQEEIDKVKIKFPDMSSRFHTMVDKTLNDKNKYTRIAKHGYMIILLWLDISGECVKSLMGDNPKVPPEKFKLFYENYLSKMCNDLLNAKIICLQEFVEKVRSVYFTL